MISSLRGKLESVGTDRAIINVGGVGFTVFMPTTDISNLGLPGTETRVFTRLIVREDHLALYGFTSQEGLWLFETLLGMTGLGPKLALTMLSTLSPEQLSTAIATGNADILEMVPGIGKKVAGRIILELKEKIGSGWISTTAVQAAGNNADVVQALTSLGYSAAEALKAISTLPANSEADLEEKIKLALRYFGTA